MARLPESPIFQFLTTKENLPAVLEVVRYAEEVREYVVDRFWSTFQNAIGKHPRAVANIFSWERIHEDKAGRWFGLVARFRPVAEKGQCLQYGIEVAAEYFGMGLSWREDADQTLFKLQRIKALQAELKRRIGVEAESGDEWWLWWEYWQRNPYTDPWSWFGKDFGDAWFEEFAGKFWDFVHQTRTLVLEANKSLELTSAKSDPLPVLGNVRLGKKPARK